MDSRQNCAGLPGGTTTATAAVPYGWTPAQAAGTTAGSVVATPATVPCGERPLCATTSALTVTRGSSKPTTQVPARVFTPLPVGPPPPLTVSYCLSPIHTHTHTDIYKTLVCAVVQEGRACPNGLSCSYMHEGDTCRRSATLEKPSDITLTTHVSWALTIQDMAVAAAAATLLPLPIVYAVAIAVPGGPDLS